MAPDWVHVGFLNLPTTWVPDEEELKWEQDREARRGSSVRPGFLGVAGILVLAKPFTVDDLQKAVGQALGPGDRGRVDPSTSVEGTRRPRSDRDRLLWATSVCCETNKFVH